jgi:hypothetical protein
MVFREAEWFRLREGGNAENRYSARQQRLDAWAPSKAESFLPVKQTR